MIITIDMESLRNGHRLTVNGEQVNVPHEQFVSAQIGSINVIAGMPSLNIGVQVSFEDETVFVDGDELAKGTSRALSIYEFHNKTIEESLE